MQINYYYYYYNTLCVQINEGILTSGYFCFLYFNLYFVYLNLPFTIFVNFSIII